MAPASRRFSSAVTMVQALVLVSALVLADLPMARAGAVFEIREAVPTNTNDLKFSFTDQTVFGSLGNIARSGTQGAGLFFKTSAIPVAIFTLNQCAATTPHIHPNAAETVFVLKGKIRIHQVRGEEDSDTLRTIELSEGQAAYIQQGAFHATENIGYGPAQFLQLFDHPQSGAVFAAPSLVTLPRNLVNSAFSEPVLSDETFAAGPLVTIDGCYKY